MATMKPLGRLLARGYGAAVILAGAAWSVDLVSWPLALGFVWIGGAAATLFGAALWMRLSGAPEADADPGGGVAADAFLAAVTEWERSRRDPEPEKDRFSA